MTVDEVPEPPHHLITRTAELAETLGRLGHGVPVAIDTEFHTEKTYWPKLALVQMAVEGQVLLVDALSCDLRLLGPLLSRSSRLVMHAGAQDIPILERATGAELPRVHDTQVAAALLGHDSISLQNLLRSELGIDVPKTSRLADWLARPLRDAQLHYAANDVRHLPAVADNQIRELERRGRTAWAEEEFEHAMVAARHGRTRPEDAVAKIKEARGLTGQARRVAAAVASWREEEARRLDLPVRFVLSDLAVVAVSERRPSTLPELHGVRGVNAASFRGALGESLLTAIAGAGKEREVRSLKGAGRRPGGDVRGALALIVAWTGELARREQIAGPMLATREELEAFCRGEDCGRIAAGWRQMLLEADLRTLLDGKGALRALPGGGLELAIGR